jgi:hypothetical protein
MLHANYWSFVGSCENSLCECYMILCCELRNCLCKCYMLTIEALLEAVKIVCVNVTWYFFGSRENSLCECYVILCCVNATWLLLKDCSENYKFIFMQHIHKQTHPYHRHCFHLIQNTLFIHFRATYSQTNSPIIIIIIITAFILRFTTHTTKYHVTFTKTIFTAPNKPSIVIM